MSLMLIEKTYWIPGTAAGIICAPLRFPAANRFRLRGPTATGRGPKTIDQDPGRAGTAI